MGNPIFQVYQTTSSFLLPTAHSSYGLENVFKYYVGSVETNRLKNVGGAAAKFRKGPNGIREGESEGERGRLDPDFT